MALDKNSVPVASRTGSVTIQVEIEGVFEDIGCLVGPVDIVRTWANDSSEETDVWCINQDGSVAVAPFEPGAMTGTTSFQLEAILSDPAYQFLRLNTPDVPFNLRIVLADNLVPVTEETLEYVVVKTSDTLNVRAERGATTRYSLDVQIIEVVEETIETATGG